MAHLEDFETVWRGTFYEVRKRTSRRYVVVERTEGEAGSEISEHTTRSLAVREAGRLDGESLVRSEAGSRRHRRLSRALKRTGVVGRLVFLVALLISALLATC